MALNAVCSFLNVQDKPYSLNNPLHPSHFPGFCQQPWYSDNVLVEATTSLLTRDNVLLFKTWQDCLQTVVALPINILMTNVLVLHEV
jgi:hypothetical protein